MPYACAEKSVCRRRVTSAFHAGNAEATRSAGRIDWTALFERLGSTFTAREMAELTGARPRHVAAITHRWRQEGWVRPAGRRGSFRKVRTVTK